ncbi:MAG: hypothetical protein WDN01_20050 [Rhizomicrobium sp.]
MLAANAPDEEEVRRTALLLAEGFPQDALRIADALAHDNRSTGDLLRAELWTRVAILIAEVLRHSLS